MKLKRPLPKGRSLAQIRNHYLVEKALAARLLDAPRNERKEIYASMYDDLFRQVPDHSRLTKREDDESSARLNSMKLQIIKRFVEPRTVAVEFAPGDCRFAAAWAKHVRFVYGIDISDQRNPNQETPENFRLVIYDGYLVAGIPDNSVDVVFSDQLLEHIHPEEVEDHFRLVMRMLKRGGKYVFRTPHAMSGPHDISKYFCDVAEGFHLKEWTFSELEPLLRGLGFRGVATYWNAKGLAFRLPYRYFYGAEKTLRFLPSRWVRNVAHYAMPSVLCSAMK